MVTNLLGFFFFFFSSSVHCLLFKYSFYIFGLVSSYQLSSCCEKATLIKQPAQRRAANTALSLTHSLTLTHSQAQGANLAFISDPDQQSCCFAPTDSAVPLKRKSCRTNTVFGSTV